MTRILCLAASLLMLLCGSDAVVQAVEKPNIVLLFVDDLGYGDVGCFGARDLRTPNLDRLAADGRRFTSFYVAQAVCTASRAALMTGSYANRVGLFGALNHESRTGIAADELLLPELLKSQGYATAAFGKWHLGQQPEFSPLRHGFDEFFGLPYSNDNGPLHGSMKGLPPLPVMEGEKVVAHDPDQSQFTRQYTDRALAFIERNRERPFFLYVPHVMPHVPIFASDKYKGRSSRGLYGDVVEELDAAIGEVVAAIDRLKLGERTLIIFASDNGPFLSYGNHAGSPEPLREGKLTTFEGGVRVPCIMRWTGTIPPGTVCDETASTIDLLPTFAKLLGAPLSANRIDGLDIGPLVTGPAGAKSPHDAFYFYSGDELQAVRSGRWKLHLPHDYLTSAAPPGRDGRPANYENMQQLPMSISGLQGIASRHGYVVKHTDLALYDLTADVGETHDVSVENPDVVKRLLRFAEAARADLGDSLTKRVGANVRPAGRL
jgi:arylsulfatase A-like enzyme